MSDYRFSTVWKYPLKIVDVQEVQVQTATRVNFLGFDPQGQLCMWCDVDPTKNKRTWVIYLVPTGGEIPDDDVHYIGTFQKDFYVGHFYAKAIL